MEVTNYMGQLYTIGHSNYPVEHLIDLLQKYQMDYLLDVRSTPYSRYAPQYNTDVLKKKLEENGIRYAPMGNYFGARQSNMEFYPNGYLDFELFRESELFKKGLDNVLLGLEQYNIALMCTEKDPIECHRTIMVARGFELIGVNVQHILHDGHCMTQEEINRRLLDMYFPERGQLSLFAADNKSDEDYLNEAYRMRNREIGYRPEGR